MRSLLMTAAVAASLSATAFAAPRTINFDVDDDGVAIAAGTAITDQYADWGVHFRGLEAGREIDILADSDPDGDPVQSGPNALRNCSTAGSECPGTPSETRADWIEVSFDTAVSNVSVWVNSLGGGITTPIRFTLYDAIGNVVETNRISGTSAYDLLTFSATGVALIEIRQPTDIWAFAIDDLTFDAGAAPVPVPGALVLFGSGLAAFAARRRKA